jgi:hypothetical protein
MQLTNAIWFVLKGEQKFGPYSQLDLIKMLQERALYEFDYIWNPNLDNWKRMAEIDIFQPDHIRSLTQNKEAKGLFSQRQHKRAGMEGTVLVHDNRDLFRGQSVEVSIGGAGIVILNSTLVPGQTLNFHFRPKADIESFNATAEIVSKKYVPGIKSSNAPMKYGVKFSNMRPDVRDAISIWTDKKESK